MNDVIRHAIESDTMHVEYEHDPITGELYHYGVLGMKWGVRRYQNKDGSLTLAGQKRVSKEYKKYADKAQVELYKNYNKRYVDAWNKAADDMNNGLTEKYNSDYAKKLGSKAKNHDYTNDKDYIEGYNKLADELLVKYYNSALTKEMKNNKNYQKAEQLCKKYGMVKFDELARETEELMKQYG